MADMENKFNIVGYRVIYAYTIDDEPHMGLVKIAERIFHLDDDDVKLALSDAMILKEKVTVELPADAHLEKIWFGLRSEVIGDITINARMIYDLAEQQNIPSVTFLPDGADLWFKTDLTRIDSIIEAARQEAVKQENNRRERELSELGDSNKKKKTIKTPMHKRPNRAIRFRPEQQRAIADTVEHFSNSKGNGWKPRFLWNAKMRFGKTLSALEVAKRGGYKSVLIITHRPVVDDGWHEDFEKIFFDKPGYKYGSRNINDDDNIGNFEDLTRQTEIKDGGFVFFVSMQYLRLSKLVGGKERTRNKEKEAILNYPWEFVVIDEAHEGTKSDQGSNVMRYLWLDTPDGVSETQEEAKKAKRSARTNLPDTLSLSGTPFNLYGDFAMTEIFTWDYVEEQEAKANWTKKYGDDPNPYDVLPKMHIFNHDIEGITGPIETSGKESTKGEFDDDQLDESKVGFSFSQFFQVWTGKLKTDKAVLPSEKYKGRFMHEEQVKKFFYCLAVGTEEGSNYPFSTDEFRDSFRHTFWMVPGVEHAKALKNLLEEEFWEIGGNTLENPYYQSFRIINVAGKSDEEQDTKALRAVKKGIMEADRDGYYTITLSCGKLTTGVSIPQWTAVFYLKGNDDTRASAYLQTIFRVQTPAVINGRQKTDAYVFDFSPTRSLRVFAEAVKLNVASRSGRSPFEPADIEEEERQGDKWLKFMPIRPLVPGEDGTMRHYDAKQLFDELNHHLTERAVRSGYADNSIYDPVAIMNLDEEGRRTLADLGQIINSSGNQETVPTVVTNPPHPGSGGKGEHDSDDTSVRHEKTEEEKKKEEWNKEKRSRMQILRAMSIRIPLLMYGAEVDDENIDLDINNFTNLFKSDRASWNEFMPPGVSPEIFDKLRCCYNPSVFRSAAKQIREYARDADRSDVEQRIIKIAEIFSFFHNPDKETVLTPWRVVNMHMSDTLGGYSFFDETFIDKPSHRLSSPRLVVRGDVTQRVFDADNIDKLEQIRILELNSKTGLYPLYVTYSLYRARKKLYENARLLDDKKVVPDDRHIWDETLRENIFIVCKTEMARKITRRTLVGFRNNPDGSNIQVNALYPTWMLTEKELVEGKVLKMPERTKPSSERKHRTDLVGVLRARPSLFEHDIQSITWWEKQLNIQLNKLSNDMKKFDAVVGNPPYQVSNTGDGNGSEPIYHLFIDAVRSIANISTLIHPARFLFNAGKTPKAWNEKILNSPNFKVSRYAANSFEIFDNVDIKGGVAITMSNKYENYGKIGIYSPYAPITSILDKVKSHSFDSFSDIVYPRDLYKLTEIVYQENPKLENRQSTGHRYDVGSSIFEVLPEIFFDDKLSDGDFIGIYGLEGRNRVTKWVKRKYIKTPDNIDKYKVLVPKSNGSGAIGEVLSTPVIGVPVIGVPVIGHTLTFLSIGKFQEISHAEACLKYIKSRFARLLLGTLKVTQDNPKNTWANVPLQDFTENSDIDWSKPVDEIDRQLYKKYELCQSEIDFIEKMIKPME